jgi:hypothetical protein
MRLDVGVTKCEPVYTMSQAKAFDDNLKLTLNVGIEIGDQRHIVILALKIYQPTIKGT